MWGLVQPVNLKPSTTNDCGQLETSDEIITKFLQNILVWDLVQPVSNNQIQGVIGTKLSQISLKNFVKNLVQPASNNQI